MEEEKVMGGRKKGRSEEDGRGGRNSHRKEKKRREKMGRSQVGRTEKREEG